MVEKITLQKFDDKLADFYDMEKDSFIIYAGKFGDDFNIGTLAEITDHDGVMWNCYLWSVEYIPALDMYELNYKCF